MNRRTALASGSLALALGAGLCLAATGVSVTGASATVAGSEGRIAYEGLAAGGTDNWQIFTVAADGTDRQSLAPHPGRDQDPAWSPDGSRLAFSSGRGNEGHLNIWVVDADGTGLTILTPGPDTSGEANAGVKPTWSPDGTQIAYSYQGGVWVMDSTSGSGKTRLTEPGEGFHPSWSPDGSTIAYTLGADIWMMDPDGTDKRQVTFSGGGLGVEKFPDWSPDGLRLVYERSGQIWSMNADGSEQTAIAAGSDAGGTRPAWSPEGDYILFSSAGYTASNDRDLFRMYPDGNRVRRLNSYPTADHSPNWQPVTDGAQRSTYISVGHTAGPAGIDVAGELFDANPGQGVRAFLQVRVGGSWTNVAGRNVTLDAHGNYQTHFPQPADPNDCRVLAKYLGDADSLRTSRPTPSFSCGGVA